MDSPGLDGSLSLNAQCPLMQVKGHFFLHTENNAIWGMNLIEMAWICFLQSYGIQSPIHPVPAPVVQAQGGEAEGRTFKGRLGRHIDWRSRIEVLRSLSVPFWWW